MTAPARACTLMRVLNPGSVCLRLGDTGAFVLAELSPPLSPRSHVAAQRVHALAPVPATVTLGPYNVAKHQFTGCRLLAELPQPDYRRVAYGGRRDGRGPVSPAGPEGSPASAGAPPPRSVSARGASAWGGPPPSV
jgi:hypothetical protein